MGFKYLGSTVQANGGSDQESGKRGPKLDGIADKYALRQCVPLRVKSKIFKSMVLPAMVYGMEMPVILKSGEKIDGDRDEDVAVHA